MSLPVTSIGFQNGPADAIQTLPAVALMPNSKPHIAVCTYPSLPEKQIHSSGQHDARILQCILNFNSFPSCFCHAAGQALSRLAFPGIHRHKYLDAIQSRLSKPWFSGLCTFCHTSTPLRNCGRWSSCHILDSRGGQSIFLPVQCTRMSPSPFFIATHSSSSTSPALQDPFMYVILGFDLSPD